MTGWNCLQLLSTYTVRMLSLADGFFLLKDEEIEHNCGIRQVSSYHGVNSNPIETCHVC